MKKVYLILLCCLGALCASAAVPGSIIKPAIKSSRSQLPAKSAVAVAATANAVAKSPARAAADHQWVDLGECMYRDDVSTGFFYVSPATYKVNVQKDEANPGFYRIVNPWKNHPYLADMEAEGGEFDLTDNSYIVIDATNPDYVRVPESPIGMSDVDGVATLVSVTELVGKMADLTQESADLAAGKLADNVITFPVAKAMSLHQGDTYYAVNSSAAFALALPGGQLDIDYTLSFTVDEYFCPDNDGNFHVNIAGDARIPAVKYRLVAELPDDDNAIYALIDDIAANGTAAAINTKVAVNVNGVTTPSAIMVLIAVDAAGVAQDASALSLTIPINDSADWEYIGKATMTEGFVSGVLPQFFNAETYEVDVEQNKANPSRFRIVEPYSPWSYASQYLLSHTGHKHYITFNSENPDNVYVETSPMGISVMNFGEWGITSDYHEMLLQYGADLLEWLGFTSDGHLKDGVLTYGGDCDIKILPAAVGQYYYTNYKLNPDYDADAAAADAGYDVPQYLGGDFRLDLTKTAGINSVVAPAAVSADAVYYNLQGVRLAAPTAGTVCICVKAGKTSKVVIR